jgi:hypothetical protein
MIALGLEPTSGGLDGFLPEEFKLLPIQACDHLAIMLNMIEGGAQWPQDLNQARAAFLPKGQDDLDNCLNYRVLMILPTLYRVWAKASLERLREWIQTWACDEHYAGTGSDGAEDAWWLTSTIFEQAALDGTQLTGAVADIYKCFDQILRDLLKEQLDVGGMPRRISEPYLRFMDSLKVRNSLAGALGAPYQPEAGIPQGCPLSMMMIAYRLRPWIMKMRAMQVTPRVLADDILLFA